MGRNADNGHVGFIMFYKVRKLNNLDECLIPCEILSNGDSESKLLEKVPKTSCVRCRSVPGWKPFCKNPLHNLPLIGFHWQLIENAIYNIPLCIKWWAGKGLVVYDEGKTSWCGNHGVNPVYVREKHPAWFHLNSEGAIHYVFRR